MIYVYNNSQVKIRKRLQFMSSSFLFVLFIICTVISESSIPVES